MKFTLSLESDKATTDDVSHMLDNLSRYLKGRGWDDRDGVVNEFGFTGKWTLEGADTTEFEVRDKVSRLSREQVVELLVASSIECRDEEPIGMLREALVVNVLDGTIEESDLDG